MTLRVAKVLLLFVVLLTVSAGAAQNSHAAEIRSDPSRGPLGVVLEGPIEQGDFDKLQKIVLEGGGIDGLYLASPGGDLVEAMKIGHLVRALKLPTVIPTDDFGSDLRDKFAARHNLTNAKANYMCASACFFIFVAGVHRAGEFEHGILGVHRPFISGSDLRRLTSDRAMAATAQTRAVVEGYLREMGVPTKYVDAMFSVSKDEVRWINHEEFETDFDGFIPELKDWVDARCDNRTDTDKKVWAAVKDKRSGEQTVAEKAMMAELFKKYQEQLGCERDLLSNLTLRGYADVLQANRAKLQSK